MTAKRWIRKVLVGLLLISGASILEGHQAVAASTDGGAQRVALRQKILDQLSQTNSSYQRLKKQQQALKAKIAAQGAARPDQAKQLLEVGSKIGKLERAALAANAEYRAMLSAKRSRTRVAPSSTSKPASVSSDAKKASVVDSASEEAGETKEAVGRSSVPAPQNYKPSTIAEIPEKKKMKNLMRHFSKLWKPDRTASKVQIISGPTRNVKFPHGNKVGSLWIVQAGKYKVELSIENGSKNSIKDLMDALRCLPDPLLWGLSKGTRTGAQIHKSLGAAAYASGHGVLLKQGRWNGLATLLLHESGHVIYNVTNDATKVDQEDEWINAMAADDISISSYGDGRWGEDVAEFGQIYFIALLAGSKKHFGDRTALQELERLSPQRFAAWRVLLQRPLKYSQPIAAASNLTFKDTDNSGSEMVKLDGSKSTDKDGEIVRYDWYKSGHKIASGVSPKVKLGVGDHKLILVVKDNQGYVDDRSFIVTVVDAESAKAVALDIVAVKASKAPKDHTMEHTIDNKLTTRWSVNGRGNWLQYDLGKTKTVSGVSIAWYSGISRAYYFSVEVSNDGASWSKAYSGESTKTTDEQEHYRFKPVKARYVKLIGQGSSANAWNNISEFDAWGTGK